MHFGFFALVLRLNWPRKTQSHYVQSCKHVTFNHHVNQALFINVRSMQFDWIISILANSYAEFKHAVLKSGLLHI